MTTREKLKDQYEDALFAMLMYDIAEIEGEKALAENERLKNDPDAAVPEDVMKRCYKLIDREFRKKKIRRMAKSFYRTLNKVAVVVLVVVLLFAGTFSASASFRESVLKLVIQTYDDHTSLGFVADDDNGSNNTQNAEIHVGLVPDGFELIDSGENSSFAWKDYKSQSEEYLSTAIHLMESDEKLNVDTEDAEITYDKIKGYDVMLIEKYYSELGVEYHSVQGVMPISEDGVILSVIGYGFSFTDDQIMDIIRSISYK